VAAPVVALLAVGTFVRNEDWHDGARLFASAATGEGQARGLLNVAASLVQDGKLDKAESTLLRAAELDPRDPSALVNLGGIALMRGDPVAAEAWCRRALAVAPVSDGWQNLAKALALQGRVAEAMEANRAALELAPSDTDARVDLAVLQYRTGDVAGALAGWGAGPRRWPTPSAPSRSRRAIRGRAPSWHGSAGGGSLAVHRPHEK
jgi:Flp pilus assembly protein TadD